MASPTSTTQKPRRIAWKPGYEGDEVALGVSLALLVHAPFIIAVLFRVFFGPLHIDEEMPQVAKPVIGATLLKLGKPIDPKQLPDRLVPRQSTAPKQQITASREEPSKKNERPDAGAPPPDAKDSDIARLIAKSDPFAEDGGKDRPEQGFANGIDGGTETDPNKVHAGDMYAAQLTQFFKQRWTFPTVISEGEARKLCVQMSVAIDARMRVWFVQPTPLKTSGNDLFDDSARNMLQKLVDDHTPLPDPPPEVAEQYRGRRLQLLLGDGCK